MLTIVMRSHLLATWKQLSSQISFVTVLLVVALLTVWVGMSSHLWAGDVLFHTDLARDFMVLEEMVETRNPTLLGPRSGGIPGVFHGPVWYYISVIPFVLSAGNPVLMGWFWWLCALVAAKVFFGVVWSFTKKLDVTLLSTIVFSLIAFPFARGPVNNFIADLFAFLAFASWIYWYQKSTVLHALLGWFLLGLLVQFQMAFAVPVAIAFFPFFAYRVIKQKQLWQLLTPAVFLLPLATFFLFEIRHDWLQVRSVVRYVAHDSAESLPMAERLLSRLGLALTEGVNIFDLPQLLAAPVVLAFGIVAWRLKSPLLRITTGLFSVWYVGWWMLTLVFSGTVWPYYYSPFFGILIFVIALVAAQSKAARILLVGLTLFLVATSLDSMLYKEGKFNSSSWRLLSEMASVGLSEPNRGYFVYSQDQLAYPLKYAFSYYADRHPETQAHEFSKQPTTVLVKAADDPNNPYSTSGHWQNTKLQITAEPVEVREYPYGYTLEVFKLDQAMIDLPVDPNIVTDLHFR